MSISKRLKTGRVVTAWHYNKEDHEGIALGARDSPGGRAKAIINVDSVVVDGVVTDRITINKEVAEEFGITVVVK